MLIKAFNKKTLFGTTVITGFAALSVMGAPAYAQTATPPAQPQSSDTTATTQDIIQSSPEQNAPEEAPADPAVVNQPDNPNEARNNQGEPTDDDAEAVEAVVVTGSRIRRDPTNAPTPLIQVGREEVLQSGEPNVVDFLADIPALSGSTVPEDTTGGVPNQGGLSLLNLRNLGAVRTLVLVDGRRHVGSAPGSLAVDVDTIPSLLIENVEIVTGGQSALYGADAVSGVVNFILRRNFEGIEIDGSLANIAQGTDRTNRRISGLIGHNFFNDRLNLYAFGEYQASDRVQDFDLDYRREGYGFTFDDADPATLNDDGVLDNNLRFGLRDSLFSRGGTFILANQPIPSPAADPDTPFQNCGAVPANPARSALNSTNCNPVRPDNPNSIFVFDANGQARPFNFGSFQQTAGFSRRLHVGGDGLNIATEFGQADRLPESENFRYQTGANFDITEDIQLYAEAKFVRELTNFTSQPTFFQIGVADVRAGESPTLFSTAVFNLGLDNAFLNQNSPALVARVRANTRPVLNASGVQTGTVLDPRAFLSVFGPSRTQNNERELTRYVAGLRGDRDRLGFINNLSYEIGYTYGEVENRNLEAAVDVERFFFATDAVRDVNNVTGR
ncbi:MAG: TonB-dependent receptor plug domain-containing protein, partial [Proteobacteria bacterium]|nr:TonB-dependent receptor plug domain-containing protein [Pseudomonadota bacterium]